MSPLDQEQFEQAAQAAREERFEDALALFDTLLRRHPHSAALHWRRSRCLESLDRESEATQALDRVIALQPDYVPALLARTRHAYNEGDATLFEPLLQRALKIEPENPQVLNLWANVLQQRDAAPDEVLAVVNRSLACDQNQVDALMMRGEMSVARALEPTDDPTAVRDVLGMVYQREPLERALEDFRRASLLGSDVYPVMRFVDTAQKLGLKDEAIAQCDIALGRLSEDDVHGKRSLEMLRARVEGGDQAIRDAMAESIHSIHGALTADRTLSDEMENSILQSTADMLRKGKNLDVALAAFVSDSPDDVVATGIARQIYNFAHEVSPGLQEVDARDYPAYQRSHAKACETALARHGYSVICDAEAKDLGEQMGFRVLIRLFSNTATASAAAFALKPKWPGMIGFVVMFLSGQWRTQRLLECKTRLRSGVFLVTRAAGPEPWDTSAVQRVQFEKLPAGTSPSKVAARHEQRVMAALAADPTEAVDLARTLDEIEDQWIETNQIKLAHRRELGYVTEGELRTLLGGQYSRFADKVRSRLELMKAD